MTKADCDAVEGGRGVWVGDSEPGRAGLWVQSTPGSLVFGTWQHLALVHNPAAEPARNLILYVDGQEYTGIDGRGLQAGIARGGTNKCTADASVADPSGPFCEPRSWSNGLRVGPTCGTEMANGGTECQTASCSIGGHPSFEGWANAHGMYGLLNYRTAARTLFLRPYLAHFGSYFRRSFAAFSVLTPGIQNVAPNDRGPAP